MYLNTIKWGILLGVCVVKICGETISIDWNKNLAFPIITYINQGDTVVWNITDTLDYTIKTVPDSADDFSSGRFNSTYSHTFNTEGEYNYICELHRIMTGLIIVNNSITTTSTSSIATYATLFTATSTLTTATITTSTITTATITTATTTTITSRTSTTTTSSNIDVNGFPKSCQNIIDITPGVPDGEYNISVNNQQYSVYCHNMSGIPATYITLKSTNPGANQAQWVFGNNLITTNFEKVRFYPNEMRIGTGDFTFSESYNGGVDPEDYFNAFGPNGCKQPLPAAGTSATDPDLLSVPFGVVGLCNAYQSASNACPYTLPDPAPNPKANIDLTGTGLRLIDNPGMDFLYYDDSSRAEAFDGNGAYAVTSNYLTPPGTTNFTNDYTIMNSHVEHRPDFFVTIGATGFCQWVTTEAWMGDAILQGSTFDLAPRSLAIRSGKGSICVCADTSNNADCNKTCNYDEKDVVFPPSLAPEAPLAPKEESGVSVGMIVGIVTGAIVVLGIGTAICVKSRYSGYTKAQLMDSL